MTIAPYMRQVPAVVLPGASLLENAAENIVRRLLLTPHLYLCMWPDGLILVRQLMLEHIPVPGGAMAKAKTP